MKKILLICIIFALPNLLYAMQTQETHEEKLQRWNNTALHYIVDYEANDICKEVYIVCHSFTHKHTWQAIRTLKAQFPTKVFITKSVQRAYSQDNTFLYRQASNCSLNDLNILLEQLISISQHLAHSAN